MATRLKLVFPDTQPDRFARTAILDQDLAVIHKDAVGALRPDVELEPGIYAARTVLADGTQLQAGFAVNAGDDEVEVRLKNVTAARSKVSALTNMADDRAALEATVGTWSDASDMVRTDDEPDGRPPPSLVLVAATGQVREEMPPPGGDPDVIHVEPGPPGRFVRVSAGRGRHLFIAAPTSGSEGAEIRIARDNPSRFAVTLGNEHADLLLRYLEGGHIDQVCEIVADHWPKAEALLALGSRRFSEFSTLVTRHLPRIDALAGEGSIRGESLVKVLKSTGIADGLGAIGEIMKLVFRYQPQVETLLALRRANPVLVTIAAYAVLLVGPPMTKGGKPTHVSRLMSFCATFLFGGADKSSDELCICAELFARQGRHAEALDLLLALPERTAPMFTYGLRFALDRLNAYRNAAIAGKLDNRHAAEIEAVLEKLGPLARHADLGRPVLTFETAPAPGEPRALSAEHQNRRMSTMPTHSPQEQAFPKADIPEDDRAKEFDESDAMDDLDAFLETRGADDFQTFEDPANWRPANALKTLRSQVNQAFPSRKKTSDGMIGDKAHCPGSSDHCANIIDNGVGVVTAFDITHDPASGCDMGKVTEAIIGSQDPRIKYIIYRSRICSSYPHGGTAPWIWRPYSGSNPHDKHAHFSVAESKALYDNTAPWTITAAGA